ncbi:trehalose-phosphatase [Paenalcaligenes niemegkensis]|uniref:trehalose-phosphatase n=1 Tax=Paenalcaligenes niemegkensis TaxID=2895469 RepID=UPI003567A2CD
MASAGKGSSGDCIGTLFGKPDYRSHREQSRSGQRARRSFQAAECRKYRGRAGVSIRGRAYGRLTEELQGLEYAWVEQKRYGVAIHYDPGSTEALAVIKAVERFISSERGPDIGILHGKNVLELKHSVATKGTAIQHLLNTSPYKGRIPFVIGDDRTDESAFLVANKVGGFQ